MLLILPLGSFLPCASSLWVIGGNGGEVVCSAGSCGTRGLFMLADRRLGVPHATG
jgi:hypothetical protein